MTGFIFLVLTILTGFCFVQLTIPELFNYNKSIPSFFVVFPAAAVSGTLITGWSTYIIGYCFSSTGDGLSFANPIIILCSIIFIIITTVTKKPQLKEHVSGLFSNMHIADTIILVFSIGWSSLIMIPAFRCIDGTYYIGDGVSGDFAIHLSLIRSFAYGNNFPTYYPFFAGEDIKYHFMYQFFIGNLEHMGIRPDISFNLLSIVFLTSMLMLLYSLSIKLFSRRTVGLLSVFFTAFRSSEAFLIYIIDIIRKSQPIFSTIISNMDYLGYTPSENWGLYAVNVYANQRHLIIGLCSILLVVMVFVEPINGESIISFKKLFFSKDAWYPSRVRIPVIIGIILGLTGFFNGSCVIGCLIVLFFLAIPSLHKIEYIITVVIATILSYIQVSFFTDKTPINLRFEPGYLIEDFTFIGILSFMTALFGVSFFLILFALIKFKKDYKWIIVSFLSPLAFAFTFRISMEIQSNHKFIIISCILCNIFIAELITMMIQRKEIASKTLAIILIIALTNTGIYELYVFTNRNRINNNRSISIKASDPVICWITENTNSNDIFLSGQYVLSEETIAGAMLFLGDTYFPWGAGYDIATRYTQVIQMYQSSTRDELIQLCSNNNIRYIIVDDSIRNNEQFTVNESLISETFECVFHYSDETDTEKIYDTTLLIEH